MAVVVVSRHQGLISARNVKENSTESALNISDPSIIMIWTDDTPGPLLIPLTKILKNGSVYGLLLLILVVQGEM